MSRISHRDIELAMIQEDAGYMVGLFLSLRQLQNKGNIPFLLASIDFYSLVIYEATQYVTKHNPTLATQLYSEYSDTIKQSRQRMKLFDDKLLGIEGMGKLFINILTPQHQKELSKDHKIPLPKFMWTDIATYSDTHTGIPVGTTHIASFNSGVTDPNKFFSPDTAIGLGEHLGSFLKLFAKGIHLVIIKDFSITDTDTRYNKIYSKKHYGSPDKQINAGLSVIDMRMNFLALLLSKTSQFPTSFKWKFLSIYHAVSSLASFAKSEHYDMLEDYHKQKITNVLNSEIASLMLSPDIKPLRNTLTHYGIDTRLDSTYLNNDQKELFGIVDACKIGYTYHSLLELIDRQLQEVLLDMFNTWRK